jgi:CrcB protein
MRAIAVFVGGAAGALARWGVGLALAHQSTTFPLATLLINVSGAFGLGLVGVLLTERLPPRRYARPLIAIGFFGAYTTFSTMAVEGVRLIVAAKLNVAIAYWVATLIFGQMAGVYGMWLGRVRLPVREKERV